MTNIKNNKFETKITADQAFKDLDLLVNYTKSVCKVNLSDEQIEYCYEWLFDCVHDTGYCTISTPTQIFNASFDEFKNK
jgi:hypothetical protein